MPECLNLIIFIHNPATVPPSSLTVQPFWRLANALKEFQAMEDELIHHLKNSLTEGMVNLEFQP